MIRILLADDQALLCEVLRNWLEVEDDLEVVGRADNGKTAIEKVKELQPDVVLIDIEMPVMDGLTATQIISQEFPGVKTIILSAYDDLTYSRKSLEAGAKAYLPKNVSAEELAKTIRSVYQGKYLVKQELIEQLQKEELRELEHKFFTKLEEMQKEIFSIKEATTYNSDRILQVKQTSQEFVNNLNFLKTDLEETLRRFKAVGITPENLKSIDVFKEQFNGYKPFLHQLDGKLRKIRQGSLLTISIALCALIVSGASIFYINQEIAGLSSKTNTNSSKIDNTNTEEEVDFFDVPSYVNDASR